MKTLKIFLASSNELEHERLIIAEQIGNMKSRLAEQDIMLKLVKWEYLDSSMGAQHKQEDYNDQLVDCDMCFALFWTKFGMYTEIEFEKSLREMNSKGKMRSLCVLFKDSDAKSEELHAFEKKCSEEYPDLCHTFENDETLREIITAEIEGFLSDKSYLEKGMKETGESKSNLQTVRIFLSIDKDLEQERLQLMDLVENLNHSLESRNANILMMAWDNSANDSKVFNDEISKTDLCLNLYYINFNNTTQTELESAYQALCDGRNPKKIYVYFKDGASVPEQLQEFRDSFPTKYGHFYCSYSNIDTLKADFLLQFMEYQSKNMGGSKMFEVADGKVILDGKEYVDLMNVPFAGNNEEYSELLKSIKITQRLLSVTDADDPEYAEYEEDLKRLKEKQLNKERGLWNTALMITKLSTERCSERLQRAIELFNSGDDRGANAILNEDEIDHDIENCLIHIEIGEEKKKELAVHIDELNLKISIERSSNNADLQHVQTLCEKVLPLRVKLYGEMAPETLDAHCSLAQAYADNNKYKESEAEYLHALNICDADSLQYAEILRRLGRLHVSNGMPLKGKPYIEQALDLTAKKFGENNLIHIISLRDMTLFYEDMDLFDEAIDAATKALCLLEQLPDFDRSLFNSIKRKLAVVYSNRVRLVDIGNNECTTTKEKGDYFKAIQLIKEVYESERDNKQASIHNLFLLGKIMAGNTLFHCKEDEPRKLEAAEYLTKSLSIAREVNDKTYEKKILEGLGHIYKDLGTPEKAESLGYSYPVPEPGDGKTLSEAFAAYSSKKGQQDLETANQIATLYLKKFPRKESYGVTLSSTEDDSSMTFYHTLSCEEIEVVKECSDIADEEECSLEEILESEGHVDLLERLLEHDTPMPLNILDSIDLQNPLKYTDFSYQELKENGELGYKRRIGVELTDDEFKEILVELLLSSNRYSMNMLVYRKPVLCQKITKHITFASMDCLFENWNSYIADMKEHKSVCESIMNPFKDILGIFQSEDENIQKFAENHQIVPECGEFNELYASYSEHGGDSFHVQMHFRGTEITISQEGVTRIKSNFHDLDSFKVDAVDVMKKYGIEKPEDIYPFLRGKCDKIDCFYTLRKELIGE